MRETMIPALAHVSCGSSEKPQVSTLRALSRLAVQVVPIVGQPLSDQLISDDSEISATCLLISARGSVDSPSGSSEEVLSGHSRGSPNWRSRALVNR